MPDQHRPCPNEGCPGTIDSDDVCDECGAAFVEGDDADIADRLACPDGNCIGVAGPDGNCTECGTYIGEPDADAESADDDRLSCPDGDCIGVIGDDGRCSECGTEGEAADDDELDDGEWDGDEDGEGDDDDRVPCPDGGCIGIIEDDGRCSECGRELEPDE